MANEVDRTGMRPQLGQKSMILPVTFDYTGGRKDSKKSANIWSAVLTAIGFLVGFGIIFNKKGFFLLNAVLGIGFIYGILLIVRLCLQKEGKLRSMEIQLIDSDFKRETKDFWGIYSVEDQYPYYCRFRNGKSGVFVRLNKDVILGKYSEAEFEHYEAIADAYNISGSSNIQICHVDYMNDIGTDERLDNSFVSLGRVTNPDVKDILTDIYSYQQTQMLGRITTFDVYVFLWSGSDLGAWSSIQRILSCFMQANYRSYHVLNTTDLGILAKTLMNLREFSLFNATMTAFNVQTTVGVVPIKVSHSDGSEDIINKTQAEKAEERRLREKEKEIRKQERKNRKKKKKKDKDALGEDEEIEIL